MVAGIAVGAMYPTAEYPRVTEYAKVVSSVFLRMIKSLIVPLLFSTLVVGIAGHGDDLKKVGRLAWRSILYFEVVTTLALAIGGFAACLYVMTGLPYSAWVLFGVWMTIGLACYALYGYHHSVLRTGRPIDAPPLDSGH